jgi:hypothetical protein
MPDDQLDATDRTFLEIVIHSASVIRWQEVQVEPSTFLMLELLVMAVVWLMLTQGRPDAVDMGVVVAPTCLASYFMTQKSLVP